MNLTRNDINYIVIIAVVMIAAIISDIVVYRYTSEDYNYEVFRNNNELHLEQAKCNLVDAVDEYIHKIAPSSCLNALVLVEACDKYDVDIKLVLAQGQIESHFGTRGIAYKTNSVFNVYSYDGLSAEEINKAGRGYKHPDHSVEPYLKLLTTRYLVDRDERSLFKSFTDIDGSRYASADDYEIKIMNTWQSIDSATDITRLEQEYKRYKIITYK